MTEAERVGRTHMKRGAFRVEAEQIVLAGLVKQQDMIEIAREAFLAGVVATAEMVAKRGMEAGDASEPGE